MNNKDKTTPDQQKSPINPDDFSFVPIEKTVVFTKDGEMEFMAMPQHLIDQCNAADEIPALLDALAGCVIQDCGCGDGPLDNKYSGHALSAYEDAIDILEKHGKMEPYVFEDGQVSGSLMRFVDQPEGKT